MIIVMELHMQQVTLWKIPVSGIVQSTGKRYSSTYNGKQIGTFNTIEEALEIL